MPNAFSGFKISLKLYGICVPGQEHPFSKVHSITFAVICLLHSVSSGCSLLLPDSDVTDKSMSIISIFESFLAFLKVIVLYVYRAEVYELFDALGSIEWQSKSADVFIKVYSSAMTIFFILWTTEPIVYQTGKLPLPIWFPLDMETRTGYVLAYIYDTVSLIIAAYIEVVMENMVIALASQLSVKINTLKTNFEKLGYSSDNDGTRQLDFKSLTTEYVEEHLYILRLIKHLKCLTEAVYFFQVVASSISIGIYMFLISQLSDFGTAIVTFSPPLTVYFMQIFTYCWSGEIIRSRCDELFSSIYSCNWYGMDPKSRKLIIMIMSYAQKEILFRGGYIFRMDLHTFKMAVEQAASYSMFLYQFSDNTKAIEIVN